MDKRRYLPRHSRKTDKPIGMDGERSGNAGKDGYTVLSSQRLKPRPCRGREDYCDAAPSVMGEDEARYGPMPTYGDD